MVKDLVYPEGIYLEEIIAYYRQTWDYLRPYLEKRPFFVKFYPEGVGKESYYVRGKLTHAPLGLVYHGKKINEKTSIIVEDFSTLKWLLEQGCIEMHGLLAKAGKEKFPDLLLFDLDPFPPSGFKECLEVAVLIREVLNSYGLEGFAKTSGLMGLHILVPVIPVYPNEMLVKITKFIGSLVEKAHPQRVALQDYRAEREGKVHLDYNHNRFGKTVILPYSIRAYTGAGVSTPLTWQEINNGKINPLDLNIKTIPERLKDNGDVWNLFTKQYSLEEIIKLI
ncbi:non-homologous end-joining DNA ligase LigD [Carboxydothermus pertinax]|uniref:DNA ligase D polymerase domain-containing protein n=1 Tax=Carboxydothermus pertinax TaxID=870242 RepID=A0A1L8CX27_9THEO|nr:hypothetical protein [Carboxydothermus pertinax]GAV23453.1 hypothetical protein cpu_19630 [Carboxydothermus pertinax]